MRQTTFAIGLVSLAFAVSASGPRANFRRHRGQEGSGRSDVGIAGRDDAGLGLGKAEEG